MTTEKMIRRYRQTVAYDLDPIFGLYPDGGTSDEIQAWEEDVVDALNEASLQVAKWIRSTGNVVLTTQVGVPSYALDGPSFAQRITEPSEVRIDGRTLQNAAGNGYGLWAPAELTRQYPGWATDATGPVTKATVIGGKLVLHPAPTAIYEATVTGILVPPKLTQADQTQVVELAEELHPHVVKLAVYDSCKDQAQDGTQMNRLAVMRAEAEAAAMQVRQEIANVEAGQWSVEGRHFPSRMYA